MYRSPLYTTSRIATENEVKENKVTTIIDTKYSYQLINESV